MYSNYSRRPGTSKPPQPKTPYFTAEEAKKPAIVFGVLCVLLPPAGMLCAWRSRRMNLMLRLILSGVGFVFMTLFFFLMMRSPEQIGRIRPTPEVPKTAGYTIAAVPQNNDFTAPAPQSDQSIPAQPDAVSPSNSYTEPVTQETVQEGAQLTEDSIVFAVTNNASRYHIYEICDFQQNNRALTLRDAINEGLQPCSKCAGLTE